MNSKSEQLNGKCRAPSQSTGGDMKCADGIFCCDGDFNFDLQIDSNDKRQI